MRFASGICLITEDVRTLTEYYKTVLQIDGESGDIHVQLELEGGGITIYAKAAAEEDMGFDFTRYHGSGLVKFTFIVDDIDAEYERLKALPIAVDFMTPPTTYPWGARSMHFRDPDGNIVCFVGQRG